jgi:hypothetical protein
LDEKVSRLDQSIQDSIREIDDKSFRYILPHFTQPEIVEFIRHYFNEKEVQEFIMKHVASLPTEDDYKPLLFMKKQVVIPLELGTLYLVKD